MAAFSIAINRGDDGFKISSFTVGTQAPSTGDMQFCSQLQDTNSVNIIVKDMIIALKAFQLALENRSLQLPAGTPWISPPVF